MTALLGLFATSVAAGTLGAILGLGGGILLVPTLTLFFGVDLRHAMGASIISVIATSSGAASAYLRTGLCNLRIGLFLVLATVSGALAGAALAGHVPTQGLELVLGLALAYSAVSAARLLAVEAPPATLVDPLAVRFSLEGHYVDARLGREVTYRAVRVRQGF